MKSTLAMILVLAGVSWAQSPTTQPQSSSLKLGTPIRLFDGESINDWVFVPGRVRGATTAPTTRITDAFLVANGILHYEGKHNGYIHTTKQFPGNYVLTVEMRHLTKGDGGVMIAITGPDKVWPRCIEVQGQFGDVADLWNLGNLKLTADPSRVTAIRIRKIGPPNERPLGQWNTLEVTSDHGNLSVKLNGQLQNQVSDVEDLSGAIGLQAQDAVMEFRKVELAPIENL